MRTRLVWAFLGLFVASCNKGGGDTASSAPPDPNAAVAPAAAAAVSAAAAASAAAMAASAAALQAAHAAVAVASGAVAATDPCSVLAETCKHCPSGAPWVACTGALTAGTVDPSACTNALADKDIRSQCGGGGSGAGAAPGAKPAAGAAAVPHAGAAAPQGATGPCAELAKKCAKCPAGGAARSACNFAVSAGNIDPSSCVNALADKDIRAECN